ncbi:ABC-type transport system, involved in lipoprotein release, permease component [Clostridium paraputrificum]|uniref:FtsX-like permease family protein n=1 Tax=Clostridium paraputrificum TaxID=29363 RepID=UPI000D8DB058|nr:FtsX-like permease family protein [Clostridium paraputrificum]SQB90083.1 ABC-type transport system, involved in lipoprotein release, permease component [Clostridium paraputrificum]
MDYGASANKIGDIANVFPVFFFLVAALVCLTTMTRMVDEQRGNIGTLKALGYSKLSISSKYIVYAAVASTLGALVGLAIGVVLFPTVIFYAWGIMYTVPKVKLLLDLPLSIISILVAVSVTTLAAVRFSFR